VALQLLQQFNRNKGKVYKYYSIAEAFYEDGKNKKKIITRLGKLDDEHAEKIRGALKLSNDSEKGIYSVNDLSLKKTYSYLDVAAIYHVIKELKLHTVLEETKSVVNVNKIFSLLLVHRILNPGSKLSAKRWIAKTVLPQLINLDNMEIEVQHIYRALPSIEAGKEKLENHLCSLLKEENYSFENIFYDLTSSYFEGDNVEKAAFSKNSKDHREDKLQLLLGLLVNKEGCPFSWDIYKGNQGESTTFLEQVEKLKKRFNLKSTLLVFDRGFLSQANLRCIVEAGYQYLTGLDSPQIETLVDLQVYSFLEGLNENNVDEEFKKTSLWIKYDDNKYYLAAAYSGDYNGHRTVVSFDVDRFKRSRILRGEKVERFKKWVDKHNEWLADFKKDAVKAAIENDIEAELKRLGIKKFITYELHQLSSDHQIFQRKRNNPFPSQGYYKKVKTFKIVFRFETYDKLDGLFALIAPEDSKLSAKEMIYYYREKNKIEMAFRAMKSLLKLRPWYVYKEEHVFAHYTICVVAYFIEKYLDLKLENSGLKKDGYTFEAFLEELSGVNVGVMNLGKNKKVDLEETSSELKNALQGLGMASILNPMKLLKNI